MEARHSEQFHGILIFGEIKKKHSRHQWESSAVLCCVFVKCPGPGFWYQRSGIIRNLSSSWMIKKSSRAVRNDSGKPYGGPQGVSWKMQKAKWMIWYVQKQKLKFHHSFCATLYFTHVMAHIRFINWIGSIEMVSVFGLPCTWLIFPCRTVRTDNRDV